MEMPAYRCPMGGHDGEAAYIPGPCIDEHDGILVDVETGKTLNQWAGGAFGVPAEIRELADDHMAMGCPPHCYYCGEEMVSP